MTEISPRETEGFLRRLRASLKDDTKDGATGAAAATAATMPSAILFYGPNQGLVRERARAVVDAATGGVDDPFVLARLSAGDFSERARGGGQLLDDLRAIPFGGGRRTLWLEGDGQQCASALLAAVEFLEEGAGVSSSFLVCEGGALRKNASLVRGFAAGSCSAVVPCYEEDLRSRGVLIDEYFSDLDGEVREVLLHHLPGERGLARRALEKVRLYGEGGGDLGAEAVSALLTDDGGADNDDLAYAFADGDRRVLSEQLARHRDRKTHSVVLVRSVMRHVLRLAEVASRVEGGESIDAAMRGLRPPVFWKREKEFRRQARARSSSERRAVLGRLLEAEAELKGGLAVGDAYVAQVLLMLCRRPRGQ
ncbi:MAG: hypothetical protein MPJ53_03030 [Alphaproteobacteria bacterium]|nr:hypothetical protein [Alphaproteobacteria bacterium]